jgi:threonine dehydrogenase-like Zn-dependent dehydrogenase
VLIIGDGFFGLIFSQLARALGAGRVMVIGHHENRLAMALENGADLALDERSSTVRPEARGLGRGFGPQVVIDTVGSATSIPMAVDLAGRGASVAVFGVTSREVVVDPMPLLAKEVRLFGTNASPGVWPEVVSLLAEGKIRPERLISRVLPLESLADAFALKASRAPDIVKLLVTT